MFGMPQYAISIQIRMMHGNQASGSIQYTAICKSS